MSETEFTIGRHCGVTFAGLKIASLVSLARGEEDVIAQAVIRLKYIALPYFICGVMDVMVGILRGLGYSILPLVVAHSLERAGTVCDIFPQKVAREKRGLFFYSFFAAIV